MTFSQLTTEVTAVQSHIILEHHHCNIYSRVAGSPSWLAEYFKHSVILLKYCLNFSQKCSSFLLLERSSTLPWYFSKIVWSKTINFLHSHNLEKFHVLLVIFQEGSTSLCCLSSTAWNPVNNLLLSHVWERSTSSGYFHILIFKKHIPPHCDIHSSVAWSPCCPAKYLKHSKNPPHCDISPVLLVAD